jgi:predicted Zn-dependent protease with MMP-like domain
MIAGKQRLWSNLMRAAMHEADAVFKALPSPLQARAKEIPVTYEPKPGKKLIKDGLNPDTLGLYIGEAYSESALGSEGAPPQIALFLENIWDYAGHDTKAYREEVRVTYVHEIGHYVGLDEDDLEVRDLD